MAKNAPLSIVTLSRRITLQMALAAATASKLGNLPISATAQETSTGTWNWGGNAGHTGELPGPGLDLYSALGELWRIPKNEFVSDDGTYGSPSVAGYLNGIVYTRNVDSLWARRLQDGELLWTQNPKNVADSLIIDASSSSESQPDVDRIFFSEDVSIVDDKVLSVLNGHLVCLSAVTGEFQWNIDLSAHYAPVVVKNIAYGVSDGGIYAVELGDQPTLLWRSEVLGDVLGVQDGLIYVAMDDTSVPEIRGLKADDGSEFWRVSLSNLGNIDDRFGVSSGGLFLQVSDDVAGSDRLLNIDPDGEIAWNVSADEYNSNHAWVMNNTITRFTKRQDSYDSLQFVASNAENGDSNWVMEVDTARWSSVARGEIVLCAGRAYALVYDASNQTNALLVADPITGEVFGSWDSLAVPILVADGIMLAQDDDTDEILAIGAVTAVLQAGGRASVTQDSTLRGAPSDSAVERVAIKSGTLVEVTGNSELSSDEKEWVPVATTETGETGWLPVDVLVGQDGSIRFSAIDHSDIGLFTSYS
ncbi:hypothetical protein BH09CHL1_BH09CHL1_07040 [soil metagenome]